jgi:hypothetical protein
LLAAENAGFSRAIVKLRSKAAAITMGAPAKIAEKMRFFGEFRPLLPEKLRKPEPSPPRSTRILANGRQKPACNSIARH